MKVPEHYHTLLSGENEALSWLAGVLPYGAEMPSVADVLNRIEASRLDLYFERVLPDPELELARWELEIKADQSDEAEPIRVWLQSTYPIEKQHFDWTGITNQEINEIKRSEWTIGVGCCLGDSPLATYHMQLKVLATIAPEAVAMLDVAACRPQPSAWLLEKAASTIPPSPTNLFCVHAIHDEDKPGNGVWMHTHGLLRCGSIEIEVLGVPADELDTMSELMVTTATLLIDAGVPEPGHPFAIGAGIDLIWVPWDTGITRFSRRTLGTERDRDESHSQPSGVLLKPARKRMLGLIPGLHSSPVRYAPQLRENPVLFVSSLETERMRRLAQLRLPEFCAIQKEYGDVDDWVFLVKLGYQLDQAENDSESEHLWFEVHNIGQDQIDATLSNEPHHITRMHEGDRDKHRLERVTDWAILCPYGHYHPDTLVHLERAIAEQEPNAAEADSG
jgi:uncharacterized protein YegJ (DUF2314 family)